MRKSEIIKKLEKLDLENYELERKILKLQEEVGFTWDENSRKETKINNLKKVIENIRKITYSVDYIDHHEKEMLL